MNYEDIPAQIEAILSNGDDWTALGIPVFRDIHHMLTADILEQEGAVADAIREGGIILGLESYAAAYVDQQRNVALAMAMPRLVLIENPEVNRNPGGLNVMPARAARVLVQSLIAVPADNILNIHFQLPTSGPLFEPYRENGGTLMEYPVRLQIQIQF